MRTLGYNIIYLIQLIRFFGFGDGARIFLKIITAKKLITIKSRKFKNIIEIRKRDSDLPIFYQVFGELQYDITNYIDYTPLNIIDCGSNVGYSCLYFATLFPDAMIIGVEPESKNYAQLCKNVKSYKNIKPINAAIWHEDSYVSIMNSEEFSAGFVMQEETGGTATLKATTINNIMQESQFDQIDILKLDVEGAEFNLFANNPNEWLNKTKCLIIELHDNLKPGTSQLFFKEMSKYNWRTFIRGENIICFKEEQI